MPRLHKEPLSLPEVTGPGPPGWRLARPACQAHPAGLRAGPLGTGSGGPAHRLTPGGEWSRAATAADGSRRRILRRRSMLNPVIEDRRPAQDAAELGRSVPGNVMIVCGSDSEHTRSSSSQITSVDLRPELL